MQILEFARNIEQQGIEYYNKLADESPIDALKDVFRFLAEEESGHFKAFDALAKGVKVPEPRNSDVLGKVKDAFAKMSETFVMPEAAYDYAAAYQKALAMENESIAFYKDSKSKLTDPIQSAVLDFIINEEKNHARLITALIEFVRRPQTWLENAEWNNLDTY